MSQLNIVAIFTVKPEYDKEFRVEFKKIVEASRKEAGCVRYDLNQDTKNPLVYVFTESWASQQAIDEHNVTEHFKHFKAFIDGKLEGRQLHILKQLF
ncbi:putative quinol monooxygenase [Zophobihabitans entericus]|uniref:Antibiotic biosynthesis monooxygenase n=1 Tax=Zophobihabitans entericus TaxID=1635327 RepID=A0A6G9ICX5_9GAMM|nr:putative quinol monooxygenase [Zophobihabitans entericus]QIQ22073.1 antibiotic biosynthesis monooxygenase [Zophobihabitans entericus]